MANLRAVLDEELTKVPGAPSKCVRVKGGRVTLFGQATTLQSSLLNIVLHNTRARTPCEVVRQLEVVPDDDDDTKLLADSEADAAAMPWFQADFAANLICRARAASRGVVLFTGAGISTAAKIPDFRGPNGVWTCRDRGLPRPDSVRLEAAVPTYTHRTIVAMHSAKQVTFVVSQNVDGLHLRSGLPRDALSELHGNCFLEACADCKREYLRLYDVKRNRGPHFKGEVDEASLSGISHITGRKCDSCQGRLRDTIIHFHENLPEKDLDNAHDHCRDADVVLCLGSSMKVTPAADQPFAGRAVVIIVSRQPTGRDAEALATGGVIVHQNCDVFMARLAAQLGVDAPDTPEAAAAYAAQFMANTRDQLAEESATEVTAKAAAAHASAPAAAAAAAATATTATRTRPAQEHFFAMLGLPTTMTQLPSTLRIDFDAPTASTASTVSVTVRGPATYPVALHELLDRIELRVDGTTVATATEAPYVARGTVTNLTQGQSVECAIFFQPGHGKASKAPLVASFAAGSRETASSVAVPPMTLPGTFIDQLRAPSLRHVETRVTRADGTSYIEAR